MVALEQEIIEKFRLLDKEAQQRVLRTLRQQTKAFDWQAWFREVEALHEQWREQRGEHPPIDVVGLLREVREEE